MGLALARTDARARHLLEIASERTRIDVPRALERGGRALARTEVAQPVLVAVGLGFAHAWAAREGPAALVLGHSLGELTAAAFALGLPDELAISLAHARGLAMAEAAAASPGGMLAVQSGRDDELAALTRSGLALAAINAPDERVLSGPSEALARAERASTARTRRLAVGGPWHHPAMAAAAATLRAALEAVSWPDRWAHAPLLSCVTASVLAPEDVPRALVDGLVSPVRWLEALLVLERSGPHQLVVATPARVLTALARRVLPRDRIS